MQTCKVLFKLMLPTFLVNVVLHLGNSMQHCREEEARHVQVLVATLHLSVRTNRLANKLLHFGSTVSGQGQGLVLGLILEVFPLEALAILGVPDAFRN